MLRRFLMHERLIVRFVTLLALGWIAWYASWALSYMLIPEGALRGKSGAAFLAGSDFSDSVLVEFARIAAINLGVAFLFVVLPNRLLHVNGYPLGYLPPLLWFIHYGALIGSNSFTIPRSQPIAPTLDVFGWSGVYEIAAYCLIAASTHAIALSRSPRLFSFQSEPVVPRPSLQAVNKRGLILAVLLLLASNLWEAYRIVTAA